MQAIELNDVAREHVAWKYVACEPIPRYWEWLTKQFVEQLVRKLRPERPRAQTILELV
jgi:hypothetical protein